MSNSAVYVASDVHLGAIPEEREADFLSWLEEAAAVASHIVINGDLFDFWFEYRHAIPRGYTRVLGLLAEIVDSGLTVDLTGGNHDWWGGSYLEQEIGVRFHKHPFRTDLAGHRALIAHGDGLGPGDLGYRAMRAVIRNPLFLFGFRWLHPDLGAWVAGRASVTKHRVRPPSDQEVQRSGVLREWGLSQLNRDRGLDLLLLGHTHVPVLQRSESGGWYINTGDWVWHQTYAVVREGRDPVLRTLGGGEIEPLQLAELEGR